MERNSREAIYKRETGVTRSTYRRLFHFVFSIFFLFRFLSIWKERKMQKVDKRKLKKKKIK